MTAVAAAMLPVVPPPEELETVERIDAKLAALPPDETKDLRSLLSVLEYLPPLLGPRLGRFTALPPDERAAYLLEWESSRLAFKRTGFAALKYLVMMFYYGDPRSWPALAYVPMALP